MPHAILAARRWLLVAVLVALAPTAASAQSAPPAAKPPLAEPDASSPGPGSQPIPDVEMPIPQLPGAIEEEEEEEGEQAMPGEGCPYRGNKLELIV